MAARVVALLLVSALAWAQDVSPVHLYQAQNPEPIGYPNWVLTPEGKAKIDAYISDLHFRTEALTTENILLQKKMLEVAAQPSLTWKGALLLVGIGLVVGAAVAVPIARNVGR